MVVLVATAILFSFALACGMPFAALGALAALTLPARDALVLAVLGWLANQAIGFGFLGYPLDAMTLAWGVALGFSALTAVVGALFLCVRCPVVLCRRRSEWCLLRPGRHNRAPYSWQASRLAVRQAPSPHLSSGSSFGRMRWRSWFCAAFRSLALGSASHVRFQVNLLRNNSACDGLRLGHHTKLLLNGTVSHAPPEVIA